MREIACDLPLQTPVQRRQGRHERGGYAVDVLVGRGGVGHDHSIGTGR